MKTKKEEWFMFIAIILSIFGILIMPIIFDVYEKEYPIFLYFMFGLVWLIIAIKLNKK